MLLLKITDADIYPDHKMSDLQGFVQRHAARGIIENKDKIALLHVTKLHYHKLPGGGVEKDEIIEETFRREALEEVGCACEIDDYLGKIVEHRERFKLIQTSHIFKAHVVGEIGKTNFMPDEIAEGFTVAWVTPHEAFALINKDDPDDYEAKFIKIRDQYILQTYLDKIS